MSTASAVTDGAAKEPVIVAAELAAAHDGQAELVITLRYGDAGTAKVVLDTAAGDRLLRNCGVADIAALPGHSWKAILGDD